MKTKGHKPVKRKCYAWQYCARCGLVYLKNEATRKAIKAPCPADSDDE